mgnify:CR=1 FL=1|jgi:ribosomal protein L18E
MASLGLCMRKSVTKKQCLRNEPEPRRRKAPVDMSRARSLGRSERVRVWEGAVSDQRSSVVRMGTVHAVSFSTQVSKGISLTR